MTWQMVFLPCGGRENERERTHSSGSTQGRGEKVCAVEAKLHKSVCSLRVSYSTDIYAATSAQLYMLSLSDCFILFLSTFFATVECVVNNRMYSRVELIYVRFMSE